MRSFYSLFPKKSNELDVHHLNRHGYQVTPSRGALLAEVVKQFGAIEDEGGKVQYYWKIPCHEYFVIANVVDITMSEEGGSWELRPAKV